MSRTDKLSWTRFWETRLTGSCAMPIIPCDTVIQVVWSLFSSLLFFQFPFVYYYELCGRTSPPCLSFFSYTFPLGRSFVHNAECMSRIFILFSTFVSLVHRVCCLFLVVTPFLVFRTDNNLRLTRYFFHDVENVFLSL
jgi:hypothetical protein